ncbi:DUF748 domain-containing protein [Sulfuricurvum sp.]|uniref:DUF748 domain-containing protein n=1 Tax=Sulfuricurvum sp. TaxID=2025608 RepID=UPI003562C869
MKIDFDKGMTMNKGIVLKSLAAATILYGVIGFFGVPYAIKHIAPQKIAEVTKGGDFSVESASFNPFTWNLSLKNMAFKTPKKGDLVALKHFSINIDPLSYIWRGGLVIGNITLEEPRITIRRDAKGDFNFKWLTELSSNDEPQKNSEPPKLLIRHFTLQGGSLAYFDASEGEVYTLDATPIGFNLDNIDFRHFSNTNGALRFYATINDGGFVELRGKIDALAPLVIGGTVAFNSGELYTPWSYFKEKLPIEVADGTIKFGFDYRFNSSDINATELSHVSADVNRLRIIPKGEEHNLLNMGALHLQGGKVLPMRKVFSAESLKLSSIGLNAERYQNGTIDWVHYIEEIQKAFPDDENETKVPWKVALDRLDLDGLGITWNDKAPLEPYKMSLDNLSLHATAINSEESAPLNASLTSGALNVLRQKDGGQIAALDGIGVDGIHVDRIQKMARISSITLKNPSVALKRSKDGSLDVSRIVYTSAKKEDKPSSEAPWSYVLDSTSLTDGKVRFVDEVPNKTVALNLEQLNVNVRNFGSDPKSANHITASTRVNSKSTLSVDGDLVREKLHSKGRFELNGLDVSMFNPYLEPSTYASIHRGSLSVSGNYDYTPLKTALNGKVALSDWVVDDSRDETVLAGWQSIGATPFTYAYPDNRLKINQLAIDGFYINALIDAKKELNFALLGKHAASEGNTTRSSSNPFGIDIVKLLVRDSSATFSDLSLPLPFKTYIHDLEGSVLGISTTKDVTTFVKLRGGVDKYGLAKIDGQLNTKAPKQYTDIKVAFDNLELKEYTPYSLQFLGYKIADGRLFLNLGYKINGGKLDGQNNILIKQIELGAEKEGGSPWPMRLVVALLEDSDGIIDIDLPIQGDVNSPDFKYGKVVWQVITNLFTKAVTSPFRLLGSMMGIENDKLSAIDFESGSAVLLPPEKEKLDQVAAMLAKRPKLSLEVYGASDTVSDAHALKAEKLVLAAMKRDKTSKIDSVQAVSLDILESMAKESLDRGEIKALKTKLQEEHKEESAFVRYYSAELVERLIAVQSITAEEIQALSTRRAEQIYQYLLKNPGLEKRVVVKPNESAKTTADGDIPIRLNIVVL